MQVERTHWAGRAAFPSAGVLRLPHDVLVEVACLLDVCSLLSLRQACRVLSALTREPVIFVRLLASTHLPPLPRPIPHSLAPSPEQRVVQACRLYKNWDLAGFPVTVRTLVAGRASTQRPPVLAKRDIVPSEPPLAAPLPYHLPPGADAYPFLKLETYAPFRDTVAKTKPSFGPVSFASSSLGSSPQPPDAQHTPALTNGASHAWSSSSDPSTRPSHPHPPQSHLHQPLPAPTPHALRPGASNYATATLRAWHTSAPPELGLAPHDMPLARSGLGPVVGVNGSGTSIGPVHCAPSPPPAPAPRPTRVASVSARAIHARIVAGGKWGVFVVKRAPGSGLGLANAKGKQRADGVSLTVEALAHLRQDGAELSKKGKARAVPIDEERVAQWAEKAAASAATAISAKSDGDTFVVIYDLDAVDGPHENGMMAEHPMKWSPAVMACRATSTGVVIVLASGPKEAVPYTTILKWSYQSPNITHLSSHKSKCPLGVMSIQEYQDGKTLVAIVHRPTTVMIQDIDTSRRCFVKLSKLQPRHTLQAVQLIPGPHLLVIRKVQSDDPDGHSYALEEYGLPPMGESVHPTKPLQRQWIRGMDLHSITLCEGPSYEGDARPDIALWGYSTLPNRAMVHWILSAGPKDGMTTTPDSGSVNDIPSAHPTETPDQPPSEVSVEPDIYSDDPETVYRFPIEHVSTNRLSFPHHKATLAPGVRRALWFERPERSRTGEARGMRGVWAYTSVERKEGLWNRKHREEREGPVVRNCTRELPEDVLNSMESNTLSVAFDESSGRAIVLTCGDSYGAASGSRIWVLDYA